MAVPSSLLNDLNQLALASHRAGRSDEALALIERAIAASPAAAVLHNNRGVILAALGRDAEARPSFEEAARLDPGHLEAQLGLGALLWRAGEVAPALACYRAAAALDGKRLDAHLAIYELAQITGDRDTALVHQRAALTLQRLYSSIASVQPALRRILVLKAPGDWQANLPLEYVLDGARNDIHVWYVDPAELARPSCVVPEVDLVFNAVAESDEAEPLLDAIAAFAARTPLPLLNPPDGIRRAARHRFPGHLAGISRCIAPALLRLPRAELLPGQIERHLAESGIAPPFLMRPTASQAGRDLVKIERIEEVAPYVAGLPDEIFYLTAYHDCTGADGLHRKYRIIFVDGEPYPYHLAISPLWIVHYYNAGMRENADRRAEEARFLGDLGAAFDPGLIAALRRLAQAIGLDYFGIDCAITRNNELLVFEVETGLIVHNLDPVEIYPYKPAAFARIAAALEALLEKRTGGRSG